MGEPKIGPPQSRHQMHISGGISSQVSSHLGGSTQYLQTSTRVSSVPPGSPASTPKLPRAERGKSGTPERSKQLIIRAEKTPPPEPSYESGNVSMGECFTNTACSELGSTTSSSSFLKQHAKPISTQSLSHSSGEISGESAATKSITANKEEKTKIQQTVSNIENKSLIHETTTNSNRQNIMGLKNERDCSTPLPVLSEWLNENIVIRQESKEASDKKIVFENQMIETTEWDQKQQELEEKQKQLNEQKIKQQQMFQEMQKGKDSLQEKKNISLAQQKFEEKLSSELTKKIVTEEFAQKEETTKIESAIEETNS